MSRSVMALGAASIFLAGSLAASLYFGSQPMLSEQDVRAIALDVLSAAAADQSNNASTDTDIAQLKQTQIDPASLHPMIESYLITNPRILERMSAALQTEIDTEETARARVALAGLQTEIYDDPDHIVLGNPEGDVTLVELYDYNCPFCRSAMPDIATLLAEDQNLRVIFKEFPILSQDSMDAARIAVAVSRTPADYWAFHTALFNVRGQISGATALEVAKSLGLNPIELELDAQSEEVAAIIQKSYTIAETLQISGTPAYIIGNEIIAGAIGVDGLRERITNIRACGETVCEG